MRDQSLQASDRVERHEARVERATAEYVEGQHQAKDAARRAREAAQGDSVVPNLPPIRGQPSRHPGDALPTPTRAPKNSSRGSKS